MRLEIQGAETETTDDVREYVERHIGFALGRYKDLLGRVVVRLASADERRTRTGTSCRVQVDLVPLKSVVMIEESDPDRSVAVARAAQRIGQIVGRRLEADRLTR